MSYLVLARKYRPRNFTEMVGQEHVVQALTNALVQQRLHHAYLFTGTRGVGKTTVSRILAKSLNCQGIDGQGGITAEPCGVCQACRDIDSGRFVDYTELDAASNRGVDEVQSLLEQAVYKPVQGRFKVFMIDEVHMLTNTAFNAMLKTLEEPPEYLKFVLATTDPQKVPVTVLSRCLQFNLRPMAPETVFEHLTKVLAQENLPSEPTALKLLARAARGSMRDALSLADQAIAFGSGQLQEATVRLMLGSVDRSHVMGLIDALARGDGAAVVGISEGLRLNGLSAASALEDMSMVLQRMAVLQAVPSAAAESDDPDHQEMLRLSKAMPADETQLLYSLCLHGRSDLGLAPDEYAALTMVLLRLLAFKPKVHPVQQAIAPEAQKKTLTTAPSSSVQTQHAYLPPVVAMPATEMPVSDVIAAPIQVKNLPVRQASEPSERTAPKVLVATQEGDFWTQTVRQLVASEAVSALVRELALQSQLIARDTDQWHLRIESESLNQGSARDRLQTALNAAGFAVKLVVEIGKVSDSPAQRNAADLAEKQKAAEDLIHADPLVQAMVQNFGAKIVPGTLKLIS
jgi:DNA polymerase-3 subunit gamma/tau